ncbi:heme NO-binding domain-containing protein [Nodularia sp. NIES-3585]|uniref:heme NO-binding domain-containing protein n=1 Tax=Nodularia sp. NIES-3585 TaxID=1973477 RepID=UPI000B5CFBE0|nr:heme NO-binding domain-containing protein [Nodularia sp. NIES-3585]GAX36017.1 heme NO binding domain-containing protein [Nodularia sp. NIES-3585]
MYGLINKGIHDMVCSRFSEEIWQQIKQKAKVDTDVFLSMEGYPDDITHRLVKAASVVLNLSPSEIMEAFGEYWVQYTAEEGYGKMMDMTGETLPEFLENLDNLHTRLGIIFPQYQPPSFECIDVEEDSLSLHYHSHREGLAPMVLGLVKGLGTRFDTEIEITQTKSKNDGAEHDEFLVKHKQN